MKKRLLAALVFVIVLAGLIIYSLPVVLSSRLGETGQISVIVNEIKTDNGAPFFEPATYSDITEEQRDRIYALSTQYGYRRTVRTLFSDGTMNGLGNRIMYIHISETGDVIAVSSTGKIAVNDKIYKMAHTEQFLAQMLEILETPSVEE